MYPTISTILIPLLLSLPSIFAHAEGIISEINDGQIQAPTAIATSLALSTPQAKVIAPPSSSFPSSIPNPVPNTTASAGSTAAPLLFTSGESTVPRVAATSSATYPMNTSMVVSAGGVNATGMPNGTGGASSGGMMGTSMAPLSTSPGMPSSTAATAAKATGAAVGGSGSIGWGVWALGGFAAAAVIAR